MSKIWNSTRNEIWKGKMEREIVLKVKSPIPGRELIHGYICLENTALLLTNYPCNKFFQIKHGYL